MTRLPRTFRPRRPFVALIALMAALAATLAGPASNAGAQIDPAANGNITITDASSSAYPGSTDPLVVCVDGANAHIMEVGDQYFVEEPAGSVDVTLFENDAATCADTPDDAITIRLAAGDHFGLVIGADDLFTFLYDLSCMQPGEGRILVSNGADLGAGRSADIYATSQTTGQRIVLAKGLPSGANAYAQDVPADTYLVQAYPPGANPDDGPPLGFIATVDLAEGTFFQVFMAGSVTGGLGGFTFDQGPDVCTGTEPPPMEPPPTDIAPSSTTTTPPASAPGDAVPATPVSGTATFTG